MRAYIPMDPAQATVGIAHMVVTGRVVAAMDDGTITTEFFDECMNRHQRGDWGLMNAEDSQVNEAALEVGSRVMSAYELPQPIGRDKQLWIMSYGGFITDGESRLFAETEVMLPSEY